MTAEQQLDIVEELEQRGDELSLRAARYIRLKQHMLAGREAEVRHMAEWRHILDKGAILP